MVQGRHDGYQRPHGTSAPGRLLDGCARCHILVFRLSIDGIQEYGTERSRPGDDLEPMYRGAVDIRRDVLEPSLADEGPRLVMVSAQDAAAIVDFNLQLRSLWTGGRQRCQLLLTNDDFLLHTLDILVGVESKRLKGAICNIGR